MDEREWVAKILAGDEAAYRDFYLAHRDRIYQACSFLLGHQDSDAEDITQEVFLAAHQQLPKFEFRSSLYHWLNRIAMYRCFGRIRNRRILLTNQHEDLEAMAAPQAAGRQAEQEQSRRKERLLELLESKKPMLSEACRRLLDMREKEDLSYAGIADFLKVPIGTVMSRLARCREALKQLVIAALGGEAHG